MKERGREGEEEKTRTAGFREEIHCQMYRTVVSGARLMSQLRCAVKETLRLKLMCERQKEKEKEKKRKSQRPRNSSHPWEILGNARPVWRRRVSSFLL